MEILIALIYLSLEQILDCLLYDFRYQNFAISLIVVPKTLWLSLFSTPDWKHTTIIRWVRWDESSLKSFDVQISVLPRATFLVSNGNNIVARNFARFATIDVKPDTSPLETEPVARDNN